MENTTSSSNVTKHVVAISIWATGRSHLVSLVTRDLAADHLCETASHNSRLFRDSRLASHLIPSIRWEDGHPSSFPRLLVPSFLSVDSWHANLVRIFIFVFVQRLSLPYAQSYVKAKSENTTVFLYIDNHDTIQNLQEKVRHCFRSKKIVLNFLLIFSAW